MMLEFSKHASWMPRRQKIIRRPESDPSAKPPGRKPRFSSAEIRRLWFENENGASVSEIADRYGISHSYASRLITRGMDLAACLPVPAHIELLDGRNPRECPHGKPIEAGKAQMCLECDDWGLGHIAALKKPFNPPKDPEPQEKAKPLPSPLAWEIHLANGEVVPVKAKTAGEAKAKAKEVLGLTPKQGLPKGSIAKRVIDKPKLKVSRKRKVKA